MRIFSATADHTDSVLIQTMAIRMNFFQTTVFSAAQDTTHHAPVIYLDDCNSGRVVRSFSWEEAKKFVESILYSDQRFDELVNVVANEGKRFFN